MHVCIMATIRGLMQNTVDRDGLALQVVDLAKAAILTDNHFLAMAIGRLSVKPMLITASFATDGYFLAYGSGYVLNDFLSTEEPPKHDLLHSVVHCLFLHPYVEASVDKRLWNLACDIAAERVVMELLGPRGGSEGAAIVMLIQRVERDMRGRADAERIYRHLREGRWAESVEEWAALVKSDSHQLWYAPAGSRDEEEGEGAGEGTDPRGGIGTIDGVSESVDQSPGGDQGDSGEGSGNDDLDLPDAAHGDLDGGDGTSGDGADGEDDDPDMPGAGQAQLGDPRFGRSSDPMAGSANASPKTQPSKEQQQQEWRNIARSLSVQLQTMSSRRGGQLPGFLDDLVAINRERMEYADFLRSFATMGEVLRLSDDEFDQVFYSYGLQLYGNLPLIEPLEYREERRVREFVIVLDTSGSVRGDAIRAFVTATFNILKTTEAFFDSIHMRILQCDVRVHSDDVVTTSEDLARWSEFLRVQGGGGTDFRPAFAYVDKLVEEGAFHDLGGLVYFTDGWGSYPEWVPRYRSAFVFYDENHRPEDVPPWAIQTTLDEYALKAASWQSSREELADL